MKRLLLLSIVFPLLFVRCGCISYDCTEHYSKEGLIANQTVRFTPNSGGSTLTFETNSVNCSESYSIDDADACTCRSMFECAQRFRVSPNNFHILDHSFTRTAGTQYTSFHVYFSTAHFELINRTSDIEVETITVNGIPYECYPCDLNVASETSDNTIHSVFVNEDLGIVRITTKNGNQWTKTI